jgi:hypothetical protein
LVADVILEGERVQVFIVPEESRDTARKAFDRYRSYLKEEGQNINITETPDRISVTAFDPLYGGVLVEHSGRYIIGAVRLKEPFMGKQLVGQIQELLD